MTAKEKEASKLVRELVLEQEDQTWNRVKGSFNGAAMTYIAKGDFLALLVCRDGILDRKTPKRRLFVCKILDVEDRS